MIRKIFSTFVMIILFFFLFSFDLDARISSRIKGQVMDEITGQPVSDVTVRLFFYLEDRSFATKRTKTDTNGNFVFDNLKKHGYFLQFKKTGYVEFPNEFRVSFSKEYAKTLKIIYLNEGEIRFVHVRLKRGASIKGTVYLKDLSGINAIQREDPREHPRVEVELNQKDKTEENDIMSVGWKFLGSTLLEKDGTYSFNGLEPENTYIIAFIYDGFFRHLETLEVQYPQNYEIDHTFDSTDKTGLSVKVFLNNESCDVSLTLYDLADNTYWGSLLEENDRYVLINALPGHYNLSIYIFKSEKNDRINKLIPVVIEEGKTTFLDLKY